MLSRLSDEQLAGRVIAGGWDERFDCADGLRVAEACANRLGGGYPIRVLGMVKTHLRGGPASRRRLAAMLTGAIPELEVLADAARRYERPPFPGPASGPGRGGPGLTGSRSRE